jgi:hypothetical protein
VVVPDGFGLGDSSDYPYPYCVKEGYSISTFNLYAVAKALLPTVRSSSSLSDKLFTAGYSEGALLLRSYGFVLTLQCRRVLVTAA